MTLDCADLRRRAEAPRPLMAEDFYERHMVATKAEILALLDLAKRLEAALEEAADTMAIFALMASAYKGLRHKNADQIPIVKVEHQEIRLGAFRDAEKLLPELSAALAAAKEAKL